MFKLWKILSRKPDNGVLPMDDTRGLRAHVVQSRQILELCYAYTTDIYRPIQWSR